MEMATAQLLIFLGAALLGAALALCYDLLVALRRVFHLSCNAVSVLDVLYAVLFGMATFLYLLAGSHGRVRGFILIGEGLGALLYKLTLSPWVAGLLSTVLRLTLAVTVRPLCWLWRMVSSCCRALQRWQRAVPAPGSAEENPPENG